MKKKYKVILGIILLVIAVRLYLPTFVKNYVNKTLDDVPGYSGSIEDVDLNLYRGAYQIEELKMVKTGEEVTVPFLDIELIDLSVQWKALFNGSIVAEVELIKPQLNFTVDTNEVKQTGTNADWTKPIKELTPLSINRFAIIDGVVSFKDFNADPEINIQMDSLNAEAVNLRNAEGKDGTLPSTVTASAVTDGGGIFTLESKANILKEIPDFDLSGKLENVALSDLDAFTEKYAKLDFEEGTFNLYTEMAVHNSALKGYVKPILTDIKVLDLSEDDDSVLELVWEGIAGFITTVFQNQPRDQFATEVPFEGDLSDPDVKIWTSIGGVFRNAFIEAFKKNTDGSVSFEDVTQ